MHRLICTAMLALALLAGCAPRGVISLTPPDVVQGDAEEILVATTRAPGTGAEVFSATRSEQLSFASFGVAVPPERDLGTVTFPRGPVPDPRTDFITVKAERLAGQRDFLNAVNASLATRPANQREVSVFVHGFNTNFAEGLYRQVQIRHDFEASGVAVHYAWPSAASVRGYLTDRESAIFARDGLDELIDVLYRSNARRIVLMGHSMGALVVMEAVRQRAIRKAPGGFDKLGAIILISPDLDIDVFRRQMVPLVGSGAEVYAFTSTRDRALRVSSLLRGQDQRLGSILDPSLLADLPVTLIDLSDLAGNADALNHFTVATSPATIALMRGMGTLGLQIVQDAAYKPNPFEAGVNVLQGVGTAVLTPLAN